MLGADIHLAITRRIVRWAPARASTHPCSAGPSRRPWPQTPSPAPLSSTLKTTYLVYDRDMEENVAIIDSLSGHWPPPGGPTWMDQLTLAIGPPHYERYQEFRVKACNDLERSRRVLRFLFANWLPQADRATSLRAPIAVEKPTLVMLPTSCAPSARALAPEKLIEALEHTILARYAIRGNSPDEEGKSFLHGDQLWEGQGARPANGGGDRH